MHRLLKGQIQDATRSDGSLDIDRLLASIEETYLKADQAEALRRDEVRTRLSLEQAEERARAAESQLLEAIQAIGDAFALYDRDDHLVICNDRYREMFGNGVEGDIVGLTFDQVISSNSVAAQYGYDEDQMKKAVARRLAEHANPTGRPQLFSLPNNRWIVAKEFRTRDGGVVGVRTDVTDMKRREDEAEALKLQYELILGSAADGIIGVDASNVVTFANKAACRMLGYQPHSLSGHKLADVLGAPGAVCWVPEMSDDPSAENSSEDVFTRSDGTTFVGEFIRAPLRKGREIEGMVFVFRDISLRKSYEEAISDHQRRLEKEVAERTENLSAEIKRRALTEQALMRSQGRLSGITSNLVEGVILLDPYGHILFANKSAHRFLQAEAGQLPGTEIDDSVHLLIDGKPADFMETPWPGVIRTGQTVVNDDAVFELPSGKRHNVAYACSPLEEDGKLRGAIISFRSIEALKEAQRETLQANRLASVGQLAAGIAHEINTPIQYIGDNLRFLAESLDVMRDVSTQIAQMASEDSAPDGLSARLKDLMVEKDVEYLLEEMPSATRQSLEGVQHVAHIVRSMKEFSHPGSTAKVATDLNRAIDSVVTVSRNEWKHVAKLETDLDPNLPAILCFAADINQVLLNLIVNAAHAVESSVAPGLGRIGIATRQEGASVEIRVSDNGPGVPPAIRDRIFDPFFTTKPVGKGTGQGLAICFDVIANKHGGKIYLDDNTTGGATFIVRLPIAENDS